MLGERNNGCGMPNLSSKVQRKGPENGVLIQFCLFLLFFFLQITNQSVMVILTMIYVILISVWL